MTLTAPLTQAQAQQTPHSPRVYKPVFKEAPPEKRARSACVATDTSSGLEPEPELNREAVDV